MILVADASFAAKTLLAGEETEAVRQWWDDDEATWLAPTIIVAEVESTIAAHHRTHRRQFGTARRRLASTTWATMLGGIALRNVNRALVDEAVVLIQEYGPLRGADALYVAAATQLAREAGDEVVVGTFDAQQRRAALAAGIPVTT